LEPAPAELSGTNLSPLIHRDKEGVLLKRAPDVDAQIREALILSPDALVERARQGSRDPGFLMDETIVYLARAYFKAGNRNVTDQLVKVLTNRKKRFIYSKFTGLEDAKDAYNDVITELFTQMLFRDDGRGDFLQVKFGFALKRIIITIFFKYMRLKEELASTSTFTKLAGEEDEEAVWEELGTNENQNTEIAYPDLSPEDQVIAREAIGSLEEPLRTTYILRYVYDFQVESIDPDEPTISSYFQVEPRTIRYRLKQAEKKLKKWQGDNHD
jgi:DNA-directed RNA polymerase specialized sigma24 family protein